MGSSDRAWFGADYEGSGRDRLGWVMDAWRGTQMLGEPGEPTAYRIEDPGVQALFAESSRYQAWLDVEAALAQAQAELGIIPPSAAEEITRKAHLSLLNLDNIRAGLARTGHSLVPLIWELDRVCDEWCAGATCTGAPRRRTSRKPASCCYCGARMTFSSHNSPPSYTPWPIWPSAPKTCCCRGAPMANMPYRRRSVQGGGLDRRMLPPCRALARLRGARLCRHAGWRRRHARLIG